MCFLGRSIKVVIYKQFLKICAWMERFTSVCTSATRANSRHLKEEEDPTSDRLSSLATRNLFSWTFFTDGIRTDEKPFWEHEWLYMVVSRDLDDDSSESSLSDVEGELKHLDLEVIRKWQEDVAAEAISDIQAKEGSVI